jgi:nicotinamidase-related amidase
MSKLDRIALVLIDIQKGFEQVELFGGNRNNPEAEIKARQLLDFWRHLDGPVFHVKHCSLNPNSPLHETQEGNQIKDLVKAVNNEPVIKKNVNSAFIGTDLQLRLTEAGINQLVIVGLTTDHCVSTSVRMAANLGFETIVVSDATATFDKVGADGQQFPAKLIHDTALASLHDEFATVMTTDEVIQNFS